MALSRPLGISARSVVSRKKIVFFSHVTNPFFDQRGRILALFFSCSFIDLYLCAELTNLKLITELINPQKTFITALHCKVN